MVAKNWFHNLYGWSFTTALLLGVTLLYRLGPPPFAVWDEARLAHNALEMAQSGLSFVTTYDGISDHNTLLSRISTHFKLPEIVFSRTLVWGSVLAASAVIAFNITDINHIVTARSAKLLDSYSVFLRSDQIHSYYYNRYDIRGSLVG
jgi:hypothetical protein